MQRQFVVEEALSFEGTMFHHQGRCKIKRDADGKVLDRGGVDCAQFPYLVYHACGLVPFMELQDYPADWFLHHDTERYLETVQTYAYEVEEPLVGDMVVWKIGRCYAHGAIIINPDWPAIVHAYSPAGMVTRDHGDGGSLAARPHKFFSIWRR
jgi:hypothetical protein